MTSSSPASRIQDNLQELFKVKLAPGDTYIRFQLTADITALLSMEQVQESSIVDAEQITPLPSMPEFVIGMIASRERVFCLFDIAQLLGLSSRLMSPRQYQIIVVDISGSIASEEQKLYLGLAVEQIQGINRITSAQINSAKDIFSTSLVPYLQGYVAEEDISIPILNLNKLAQAARNIN